MQTVCMRVPNYNLLPDTIVSAEIRNGNLIRCGPGVRGVGWPETPMVRAMALSSLVRDHELVAVLFTAAWLWGANPTAGPLYTFSTFGASRYLRQPPTGSVVHEFSLERSHVTRIGAITVSSPERTFYDVLFLDDEMFEQYGFDIAQELMHRFPQFCESWNENFHSRYRPHAKRARARYAALTTLIP